MCVSFTLSLVSLIPPGPGWVGFLLNMLYLAVYYTMMVPHATISLLAGEA